MSEHMGERKERIRKGNEHRAQADDGREIERESGLLLWKGLQSTTSREFRQFPN